MHLYFKMQHLSYNIFVLDLTMKLPEYATKATLALIRGKIFTGQYVPVLS